MKRVAIVAGIVVAVAIAIVALLPKTPKSVRRITHVDAKLQAASREAVANLPRFIARLKATDPDDRFAIRVAFPTSMGPEYLWVRDVRVKGEGFEGVLDQEPIAYKIAKKGDVVDVARTDVYDWMIRSHGVIEGGKTEEALRADQ